MKTGITAISPKSKIKANFEMIGSFIKKRKSADDIGENLVELGRRLSQTLGIVTRAGAAWNVG